MAETDQHAIDEMTARIYEMAIATYLGQGEYVGRHRQVDLFLEAQDAARTYYQIREREKTQ